MSDIAKDLRERSLLAEQEGEPLALLDEAAEEIERLRLTDEEREAIKAGISACENITYGDATDQAAADIMQRLLERLK
jgi:uncharacterized membrane protein